MTARWGSCRELAQALRADGGDRGAGRGHVRFARRRPGSSTSPGVAAGSELRPALRGRAGRAGRASRASSRWLPTASSRRAPALPGGRPGLAALRSGRGLRRLSRDDMAWARRPGAGPPGRRRERVLARAARPDRRWWCAARSWSSLAERGAALHAALEGPRAHPARTACRRRHLGGTTCAHHLTARSGGTSCPARGALRLLHPRRGAGDQETPPPTPPRRPVRPGPDHRLADRHADREPRPASCGASSSSLNPGMLGQVSVFQKPPAPAWLDARDRGARVRRVAAPFHPARTKEAVEKDLPEKLEETLYCELKGDERRRYDELRDHTGRCCSAGSCPGHGPDPLPGARGAAAPAAGGLPPGAARCPAMARAPR